MERIGIASSFWFVGHIALGSATPAALCWLGAVVSAWSRRPKPYGYPWLCHTQRVSITTSQALCTAELANRQLGIWSSGGCAWKLATPRARIQETMLHGWRIALLESPDLSFRRARPSTAQRDRDGALSRTLQRI